MNSFTPRQPLITETYYNTELDKSNINELMQIITPEKQFLLNHILDLQISLKKALLIIYLTDYNDISQVLQYIVTDENGFYNHPYCNNDIDNCCLICEADISKHKESNSNTKLKDKYYDIIKHSDENELYKLIKTNDYSEANLLNQLHEQTILCDICYISKIKTEMLNAHNKEHSICIKCFEEYLTTEINSHKVVDIKCPECKEIITTKEIETYTKFATYSRYLEFLRNHLINTDPLKRWCPNPQCNEIITLTTKYDKTAICFKCGFEICTNCNRKLHLGVSCEKILEKDLSEWTQKKDVQRCPKCKILVEKIQGCNHMTCQLCYYEWCWLCRSAYTNLHFVPINPFGCPGLQAESHKASKWSTIRLLLLRMGLLIGLILLFPLGLVSVLPVFMTRRFLRSYSYRNRYRSKKLYFRILILMLISLLGILLNAIFVPLLILSLIPGAFWLLYRYCKQRMIMLKRHKNAMEAINRANKSNNVNQNNPNNNNRHQRVRQADIGFIIIR